MKLSEIKESIFVLRKGKVPYQLNGNRASPTNPTTWATYEECKSVLLNSNEYNGIGINLVHGLACIDIDDYKNNDIEAVRDCLIDLNTYTEISQSGKGLHIIFKSPELEPISNKKDWEFYKGAIEDNTVIKARFIALTENVYGSNAEINFVEPTTVYEWLNEKGSLTEYKEEQNVNMDSKGLSSYEIVFNKISRAKNGNKFRQLMNGETKAYGYDQSRARYSLINMLLFYTRDSSIIQMFLEQSKLDHSKFSSRRTGKNFLEWEIQRAKNNYSGGVYKMNEKLTLSIELMKLIKDKEQPKEDFILKILREIAEERAIGNLNDDKANEYINTVYNFFNEFETLERETFKNLIQKAHKKQFIINDLKGTKE